jgi:hypothetical protein
MVRKACLGKIASGVRPREGYEMADLKLTDVKKAYGAIQILHGINLDIK